MKRWKLVPSTPMAAAIAAGLIVGMLVLSYLLSSGFYSGGSEPPPLPVSTPEDSMADGTAGLQGMEGVVITPRNVQAVIKALERTDHYTQTVTNILYYDGRSSSQTVTQYVRADACRTDVLRGGVLSESYLRAGDHFYAWQPGSGRTYFRGAAGDFSTDSMAMLPDWQTVAELPAETITSAGLEIVDGEPVLLVTAVTEERTSEYVISAVTGLLSAAQYYTNGEMTREIRVAGISSEEPELSHFLLPDGTSVLPAEE